jgi:hypothetical protein
VLVGFRCAARLRYSPRTRTRGPPQRSDRAACRSPGR